MRANRPSWAGTRRYKDYDDEDTHMPILPSGSDTATATKADIDTLYYNIISIEDKNETSTQNVFRSKDVLPSLNTLNFLFQGIGPCIYSDNFPVREAQFKLVSNSRVQNMSCFDIFCQM